MKRTLEQRVTRLEKLVYNEESESNKPNIYSEDINEVKAAIAAGEDVNTTDENFETPLWRACNRNDTELAKFLVNNGAKVHFTPFNTKMSCLYYACHNKNLELAKFLVKHGADNDPFRDEWDTPIARAIYNGMIDEELLDPFITSDIFYYPLGRVQRIAQELSNGYIEGKIPESTYKKWIESIIPSGAKKYDIQEMFGDSELISKELQNGKTAMLDIMVDKGILPLLFDSDLEKLSTSAVRTYYNVLKNNKDLVEPDSSRINIQSDYVDTIKDLCKILKTSSAWLEEVTGKKVPRRKPFRR